jgi:ABC-2 type transport system ATP-binding protein
LATHILEEIRKLADFIVFLHQGRLLGVFEKDALLGDWKRFWIERLPADNKMIPGVAAVELNGSSGLVMLVSSDADQTEQHLVQTGIGVLNVQAMELQDILTCLIELKMKG